jgi:hypothetical protein
MRELTERDIDIVRKLLISEIGAGSSRGSGHGEGYAFGGEFLEIIASNVLIPILVSLTSSGLYDVLKGKVLGKLSERESKDLAAKLIRSSISLDKEELSHEILHALASELEPMGFTSEEIAMLCRKVRLRLAKEKSSENLTGESSSHT